MENCDFKFKLKPPMGGGHNGDIETLIQLLVETGGSYGLTVSKLEGQGLSNIAGKINLKKEGVKK